MTNSLSSQDARTTYGPVIQSPNTHTLVFRFMLLAQPVCWCIGNLTTIDIQKQNGLWWCIYVHVCGWTVDFSPLSLVYNLFSAHTHIPNWIEWVIVWYLTALKSRYSVLNMYVFMCMLARSICFYDLPTVGTSSTVVSIWSMFDRVEVVPVQLGTNIPKLTILFGADMRFLLFSDFLVCNFRNG